MSNSLRDQLIKAGLVTKKQAHETRKRKPRGKQAHKARSQEQTQRESELKALDAHKRERDRELNAQREAQRKAREQADWVRQMLGSHAQAKGKPGDEDPAFHFTLAGAVQRTTQSLLLERSSRAEKSPAVSSAPTCEWKNAPRFQTRSCFAAYAWAQEPFCARRLWTRTSLFCPLYKWESTLIGIAGADLR